MIAAVTGGTGFIGRHLVNELVEQGVQVRLLTRQPERLKRFWPKGNIEPWQGDLTLPDTLRGFTDSAQVIYHLGGEVRNVNSFNSINVDGTQALLKICRDKNIEKFVHLSSVGVIGASGAGFVNESTPCHPKNEYERSKFAGEQIVLAAFKKYQVPITVLRPTIVFGEGPNKDHDSLARWLYTIQKGWFRFIGTGDTVANYVYVGDVVWACFLVAKNAEAIGKIYIVSDSCSLHDFVGAATEFMGVNMPGSIPRWLAYILSVGFALMAKATPFSSPLTINRVRALTSHVTYSRDKLSKELGFQPTYGWREGLRRTIAWYRQNNVLR